MNKYLKGIFWTLAVVLTTALFLYATYQIFYSMTFVSFKLVSIIFISVIYSNVLSKQYFFLVSDFYKKYE